jgi:hypothetical protein
MEELFLEDHYKGLHYLATIRIKLTSQKIPDNFLLISSPASPSLSKTTGFLMGF